MKLYLSGPMQGLPNDNFPAFELARTKLREAGYEVVCPAELGRHVGWTWEQYLRRDIRVLLDCDAAAVLDGWENSRGAKLEMHIANELGFRIEPIDFWITQE